MKPLTTNAATDKLSPQLPLSAEQQTLLQQIIQFTQRHFNGPSPAVFTIFGDAGTGKSVVLSHLFAALQQASRRLNSPLYGSHNFFLVNHPEILKVYRNLAPRSVGILKKQFQRPTTLINQVNKGQLTADILVIDEAHLLLSKPDHYNNFYGENQLVELLKVAKVVILVFDETQVLRMKSFWTEARLLKLLSPYPHASYRLTQQFRMTASDDLVQWINRLTHGDLTPLPADGGGPDYDLQVFDDAEKMRQQIVKKNQRVGLSRIVSTSGYPSTLDGGQHFITEGAFKMPWDQYNYTQTPWAEIPDTINEVGSIYTCQGFDLNYVGVILGPPVLLDPISGRLMIDLDKNTDVETFKHRNDITDPVEREQIEKQLILNSINVLLKRGIHGLYLFAHDDNLRRYLQTGGHA